MNKVYEQAFKVDAHSQLCFAAPSTPLVTRLRTALRCIKSPPIQNQPWPCHINCRVRDWCLIVVSIASGKLHKDYTVYEDVKSILPIYIQVYPVRPCRDDLCEIIPSIWGAVARYDRSDLFIIACGQSHLFMNMLWSAMISCELSYLVATVLLVLCGDVFRHKIIEWKFELKSIFIPCLWLGDHLGEKT